MKLALLLMQYFSIYQMLADLMFRKNEYDSAMYHFQQLLQLKAGI